MHGDAHSGVLGGGSKVVRLNVKVTASLKDSLGNRDENGEEQKLSDKDDDDLRQYPMEYDDRDKIEMRQKGGNKAREIRRQIKQRQRLSPTVTKIAATERSELREEN